MMKFLIIGASAIALAAGAAEAAQPPNSNGAVIQQVGTNPPGKHNYANIDQTTASKGYSEIIQDGTGNSATNNQSGTLNQSYIFQGIPPGSHCNGNNPNPCGTPANPYLAEQPANSNIATVTQSATASNSLAYIGQFGDGNSGTVIQAGVSQVSDVEQYSDSNYATVNQAAGATSAYAVVYQGINENTPQGTPGNPTVPTYTDTNPADYSNDNLADAPGSNNTANLTQTASAANARGEIYQGASDNYAEIYQNASGVQAYIVQQGGGLAGGGNNYAVVGQGIANSQAFVRQVGISNRAEVYQNTTFGFADVRQTGVGNQAVVNQ